MKWTIVRNRIFAMYRWRLSLVWSANRLRYPLSLYQRRPETQSMIRLRRVKMRCQLGLKAQQERQSQARHTFLPNASSTEAPAAEPDQKVHHISLLATWRLEIFSPLLAIAALIAIAVTMSEYNKKEQPAWKYTINLNNLIAILSTLLRACMVAVVEEGKINVGSDECVNWLCMCSVISQLKWLWFRRPMPLQHLSHFDTAARGPWGSLRLLFRTKRLLVFEFRLPRL